MTNPLIVLGHTKDGAPVLGGAFQMADTLGFPLAESISEAKKHGSEVSILHYFASAIEHGWDDIKTFSAIHDAYSDAGVKHDMEEIKNKCIAMFMKSASEVTEVDKTAVEIAKKLRLSLEEHAQ